MNTRVLTLLFFGLFAGSLLAGGVIRGKIVQGTNGFVVPEGLEVYLNRYQGGQADAQFKMSVLTDALGKFLFSGLPEMSGVVYEPMVIYQGIKYYGQALGLKMIQDDATSEIVIYENTTSDSALSVRMHHLLIEPAEGFLRIQEVLVIDNESDRTYTGSIPAANGKKRTITYRLPNGADELQMGEGAMSCCIQFEPGGFYDTMEIPPGRKQISFAYHLPALDKTIRLKKQLSLKTAEFDVMVMDSSVQVRGSKMIRKKIPNMPVQRFVAENLEANEIMELHLAGLTGTPFNLGKTTLYLFGLLLLILGVYAFYTMRHSFEQDDEVAQIDPELERENLLQQIINLDRKFDKHQMSENEYREMREALTRQMEALS